MTGEAAPDGIPAVSAASAREWRDWLAANCTSADAVWLVLRPKRSPEPCVGYAEAVEQALCFGWVDSKQVRRDADSTYQKFTPRRPGSRWSVVNRERVERLTAAGLMTVHGQAVVDQAQRAGTWDVLAGADVDELPDDLARALAGDDVAARHFARYSSSRRRQLLEWIATAKRPETRARRIAETVEMARLDIRAGPR